MTLQELLARKPFKPPDDVCPSCNTASLRIDRSIIAYENDDTPEAVTQGYTIAVIKCVNPDCKEYNQSRFGGAEKMAPQEPIPDDIT